MKEKSSKFRPLCPPPPLPL